MVFNSNGRIIRDVTFSYNANNLELVQSFTYLGIDITDRGTFTKAISSLTDKGQQSHVLTDTIFKFNLQPYQAIDLFYKSVKLVLIYGSEIWSAFTDHQISAISAPPDRFWEKACTSSVVKPQLKFCKQILGLKRNFPSLAINGELVYAPLLMTRQLEAIKYWYRATLLYDDSLVAKACKMEDESVTLSNWLMTIKLPLNAIGLSSIYDRPWCFSTNYITRVCKQKLSNYFSK